MAALFFDCCVTLTFHRTTPRMPWRIVALTTERLAAISSLPDTSKPVILDRHGYVPDRRPRRYWDVDHVRGQIAWLAPLPAKGSRPRSARRKCVPLSPRAGSV